MGLKKSLNTPFDSLRSERALQSIFRELVPGARLCWQEIPQTGFGGFLVEPSSASQPLESEATREIMESPPFWCLLWPAGHHLCRLFSENPALMQGRSCLDLGSGSGLVSVSLAITGARVLAVDSDKLSLQATRLNMERAGVEFEIAGEWEGDEKNTLVLADFLYDESNLACLENFLELFEEIIVVDSRLESLELPEFHSLGQYVGLAVPDLDPHREFGTLRVWYAGNRLKTWRQALQ